MVEVLQEAVEGGFIGSAARRAWALSEDTCPRRSVTNGARGRWRRRRRSRRYCTRVRTSTGARGKETNTVRVHYAVGRTVPVLAAASSGVGERQGGVMEVETRMVARGGTLWPAEQQARAQQRRWRRAERAFGMPAPSDERDHHVDRDIRPHMH